MLRTTIPLLICLAVLGVSDAHAGPIWTQLPGGGASTNITELAVANDFTLSATTTLTDFRVWISDWAQTGALDGTADNFSGSLGWAIYSDAPGMPDSLLFSGTASATTVASTSTLDAATHEIFSVDGAFAGTPTLAAGTYWLAIRDGAWGSVSDGSVVGWTDSSPVVGNVLNIALDEASPTSWFGTGLKDSAFVLNPVVVPLPAAAWMGLALLGVLGVGRRARRGQRR